MKRLSQVSTWLVLIFLFMPLVLMFVGAFDTSTTISFPPKGLTTEWFQVFFQNKILIAALGRSLWIGLLSALLSVIVGICCSLLLVRYSSRFRTLLSGLSSLPLAIPRIILGVAVLTLMYSLSLPRGWLYLLVGHVVMIVPYAVLVVSSQLVSSDLKLEEAAANLGANRMHIFLKVTLPIAFPGIVAAFLFAFTVSFQDAEASLLWIDPANPTLPVALLSMIRNQLTPEINAVAVVMMVISIGLPIAAERVLGGVVSRSVKAV